jgi:hypothetical protein
MNDNNIIIVDEAENKLREENDNIIINSIYFNQVSNKRRGCLELCSDLIMKYIDRQNTSKLW